MNGAVIGVALLALAGCGGTTTAAAPPSPSASTAPAASTPASTPVTSPTFLTVKEAGKRYLELVGPGNAAAAAWSAEERKAKPSLAKLRNRARAHGDALAVFIRELQAAPWPPEVQDEVDVVVRSAAADIMPTRAAQAAQTLDEYWAAVGTFPEGDGSAQVLRAALGLSEVPTS